MQSETTKFIFTRKDTSLPFKTQCSREKRNQEAIQQTLLLGFVTQFHTVTLEKPTKKSNVTEQIPKIISIEYGNETFEFDNFVKDRFKSDLEQTENDPKEHVKSLRIYNRNIHIFTNNYLFDLCMENGFTFSSHLSKVSKNIQRFEYFDSVFYRNRYMMDNSRIVSIGKNLCRYFSSLLSGERKMVTLPAGDNTIAQILGFDKMFEINKTPKSIHSDDC